MDAKLTQYIVANLGYYRGSIKYHDAETIQEVEEIIAQERLQQSDYGHTWVVMQPIARKVSYQGGYTLPEPVTETQPEEEVA